MYWSCLWQLTQSSYSLCCFFVFFIIFTCPEGVIHFTLEPADPSYAKEGSNVTLVWDYKVDDRQTELLGIVYSVLKDPNGPLVGMLVETKNGSVMNHQSIPSAYKGRVKITGTASLVIENVTPRDNTLFQCKLVAESGADQRSIVQLIVTGENFKIYTREQQQHHPLYLPL